MLEFTTFVLSSIAALRASRHLHSSFVYTLLRVPLVYYDKTPLGRILNRLSDDLSTVDIVMPFTLRSFINGPLVILSSLLIISCVTPWCLVPVPLLVLLYTLIQVH